ncbi:hypothetical protein FHN55_15875 [Streptomyces sp. NP160]|nr:hypothetical protein FHN55_15875 [Streptomyces sp. NP160]
MPQHVQEQALRFFSLLRQGVEAMVREHPEEELRAVVALSEQRHETTDDGLSNLQVESLRQ